MNENFIETEQIENYLWNRLAPGDRSRFELKMLTDTALAENTEAQAITYKLVRRFWRRRTRRQLLSIHQQLMQETAFVQQLY